MSRLFQQPSPAYIKSVATHATPFALTCHVILAGRLRSSDTLSAVLNENILKN